MVPDDDGDIVDKEESTSNKNKKKGYRHVEEWHAEHSAKNPHGAHVLANLKRERARWSKTFDDLGGDGI